MLVRYDRPVSRSAFLARRLALFALGMLGVVVLAHRFGPLATPDFVLLVLVCAVPARACCRARGSRRASAPETAQSVARAASIIRELQPFMASPAVDGNALILRRPFLTEVDYLSIRPLRGQHGNGGRHNWQAAELDLEILQ